MSCSELANELAGHIHGKFHQNMATKTLTSMEEFGGFSVVVFFLFFGGQFKEITMS